MSPDTPRRPSSAAPWLIGLALGFAVLSWAAAVPRRLTCPDCEGTQVTPPSGVGSSHQACLRCEETGALTVYRRWFGRW